MSSSIQHIAEANNLHYLSDTIKQIIARAQRNGFEDSFATAADVCERALSDMNLTIPTPAELRDQSPTELGDLPIMELQTYFDLFLTRSGTPAHAVTLYASSLSHRVQLLRAFEDPDQVIEETCKKVIEVVGSFPRTAEHIRCGNNPGDVLDPYILAAAQVLMCGGDFERTISASVAHNVLMVIEGLLGHLHEDVIGAMRGNVRVPEPRGKDQETLDYLANPFPGADILQPPTAARELRFFQVKSKTGSAKGGDGKRLGVQLKALTDLYGGSAYYSALIGNTLRGHRSMRGVLRAAPSVVILVGESSFRELTGSGVGPQLLLRLYQAAFEVAAKRTGYSLENTVTAIYHAFRDRAAEMGEGFLDSVLLDAVSGPVAQQDSRTYQAPPRGRKRGTPLTPAPAAPAPAPRPRRRPPPGPGPGTPAAPG